MPDPRLQVKVTTDAKEASAAFSALAKDIKAVGTESVGVTEGVSRVDAAMQKLARAPDTAMGLARAIAKATVEVEDLRAALDKTPASAEKMKAISTAVAQAEAAIEKATQRASRLKDAMEQTSLSVEKGKDRVSAFGAALSSPTAAFDKMRDSASGFEQSIGKLGGSLIVAQQGFELAQKAGQALAKAIDEWDAKRAASDKAQADAEVRQIKFAQALKLAEKGTIDLGHSTEDLIRNYDAFVARTSPVTKALDAQTEALRRQKLEMTDVGRAISEANKGKSFSFIDPASIAESEKQIREMGVRLNELLGKAFKEGGAAERDAWGAANREAVEKAIAAYAKFGVEAPAHVKAAYDAMRAGNGPQVIALQAIEWVNKEAAAYEDLAEQVKRTRAQESAVTDFSGPVTGEFKAIHDAALGAAVAAGQFGTDLDRVAESVVKAGGSLTAGAPIFLQVKAASDEARASIIALAEAYGTLREEQGKSLDATKGWTDYLVALKEGYDSGVTSLGSYMQQLIAFKSQVQQMFAGATGAAKESVTALEDVILSMMNNIGSQESYSSGYLGELERALDKGKK